MPKYFDDRYNIITLEEYVTNILSYQYSETIVINDKDYFSKIQKDYFKDFYCAMIDNDIEPRWNENLLDKLIDFNSPYDYLILDIANLEAYIDSYDVFTWVLLDIVNYVDMQDSDKFAFYNSLVMDHDLGFVIKLKRIARNIKYHPINIEDGETHFDYITDYKYDGLDI
jgi:hypothetical protein